MSPGAIVLRGAAGMLVLAGAFVYNTGAVMVEVREKSGKHFWLAIPAVVVPIGVKLVPKEKLRDATRELQPWLAAIQAASEELCHCQDGPLVEVDDPGEHVRIAKQGDRLVIDVDSEEETVHVSCPLGVVAYTARQLRTEGPPA